MHRGLVFQNIAQKNDPRARFVVITWPKAAAQSKVVYRVHGHLEQSNQHTCFSMLCCRRRPSILSLAACAFWRTTIVHTQKCFERSGL